MKNGLPTLSRPCAIPSAERRAGSSRPGTSRIPSLPRKGVLCLCLLVAALTWIFFPAQAAKPDPSPAGAAKPSILAGQGFIQRLILGAREETDRKPWYRSAYYSGGYPPATEGVCTDLVWRAFQAAGYDLKKKMDADIRANRGAYPRVGKPDPNIDFRRVPNQTAFFRRHAKSLTTRIDAKDLPSWQPGDIVVFTNPDHIAILSDRRNDRDFPLLLHNQGPFATEGDDFMAWYERGIVAHFRFIP